MYSVERNVWLEYGREEISEKIRYWVDRWEELFDNFNVNSYGLKLSSPHLLVRAISDEIEHNDLRNKETRRIFKTELGRALKTDPVVGELLKVEFVALIKNLDSSALLYLNTVCGTILPFFASGDYFRRSVSALIAILTDPEWHVPDRDEIARLSNVLSVEFLLHNYHSETVRGIPVALFSQLNFAANGSPATDFPHNVDWRTFRGSGQLDIESYRAAVSLQMEGLTMTQRLKAIEHFYDRPMDAGTVIFPVAGLRNASKQEFRTVTLYSPVATSLLSAEQLGAPKDAELFGREVDLSPVNVAVRLSFRDAKAASVEAAEIAEELFDWMQPHWTPEYAVEIDKANYIVADSRGWIVYHHRGATSKHPNIVANSALDVRSFFDALKEQAEAALKSIANSRPEYPLASKMPVCLRWYRKAVESTNLEDRLLNYWIVLERAFDFSRHDQDAKWSIGNTDQTGKFAAIIEYVPVQDALHFMYGFGWQLHHYLDRLVNRFYTSPATNAMVPYISLSPELQRQCRFDRSSHSLTLDDFLPHLDRIATESSDRVVREKVEEAALFYRDPHVAREVICKRFESTRDEIVLIYRLRNSIVHRGHFDRKLLEPFAARAGELARVVLGLLFSKFLTDPALSVETIFTDAKVRYDRTIARLEGNLDVDFVTPKPWGMYPRIVPAHTPSEAGTST